MKKIEMKPISISGTVEELEKMGLTVTIEDSPKVPATKINLLQEKK